MIELARHGTVTGVELSSASVMLARERGVGEVIEGSVLDMPFAADSFDVAVSLDVIEHLEDDLGALREMRRTVTPGGSLLVTVPAYPWLWSGHDVALGHRRRYSARGLARLVERAGLHVVHASYFNTLLFPAVALTRVWKRLTGEASHDLHRPSPAVNQWLERVFALERHVVPRVALPFGASLLLVARR